jgi:dTDP-4-amino-4,6-dideoxygalactose transaminase
MIPRLKPYLDQKEILAAFSPDPGAVEQFETEFARTFEAKYAIAFPYGRSALWAFFKALGIQNAEIIMPAYSCSVVAHAIVLSGNIPRFVDITLYDYNMNLDQVAEAINKRTQAIVATHLFGYPLNVERLSEIVRDAENRYGHKIWVIQDCAHSFGARWRGELVCGEGDVALFGLNISKIITSIFGGMLTTNNPDLAQRLRSWRDGNFVQPHILKAWQRRLYLMAVYPAFNEHLYGFVVWLQDKTPFLNRLTKSYHLDEKVHFPPDFQEWMLAPEAQVGIIQLEKYPKIVQYRQEIARFYDEQLRGYISWGLPPIVDGATYSHYVIRVPDRIPVLQVLKKTGIQLGQLIEYSIPHMSAYRPYAKGNHYPVSLLCSQHTVNLPIYPAMAGMVAQNCEKIKKAFLHIMKADNG